MNDDFLQKLMSFLQLRQSGPLVPMSSGGVPMGSANDYLQQPRAPMPEQVPSAPQVDLQSLIRMLSGHSGSQDMNRFGVNGAFPPEPQYPMRLNPHAVGVRG